MSTLPLNPFPDYAVKRLVAGPASKGETVLTAPILQARSRVDDYCSGLSRERLSTQTNAALCAVRGDYGTGKTHLLNHAASYMTSLPPGSDATLIRATCIETDALAWYKTKLGPELDSAALGDVITRLYARAGQKVAGALQWTASAAELLAEHPLEVRRLIQQNQLSVDAVGREFERMLGDLCGSYDPTARQALSKLMWPETEAPARAWIRGTTLAARDAELLGLPTSVGTADLAASVMGAIAAVHSFLHRPFVVMVDELEHFTRYDIGRNSWSNITWLKRLLEILGESGALVLVAGHWDAWETTKDYLDRFPQYPPIDLLKLTADDVMIILTSRLLTLPAGFDLSRAAVIADVTGGNMRRVMSLCNLLFRTTEGFQTPPSEGDIRSAWGSLARRVPREQAVARVTELLVARGYRVESEFELAGIRFDLVACRTDGRTLVLDVLHITTQQQHYDTARRFMDKMQSLTSTSPLAVGFYLVDGSIDDDLLGILRSASATHIRWFDLTVRDVLEKIEAEIEALDTLAAPPGVANSATAQPANPPRGHNILSIVPRTSAQPTAPNPPPPPSAVTEEFETRLRALDERRAAESSELMARLDSLSSRVDTQRQGTVITNTPPVNPERARLSYESLVQPPQLQTKLRYLGTGLVIGLAYIAAGAVALVGRDLIAVMFAMQNPGRFNVAVSAVATAAVAVMFLGVSSILFRYFRVVDYFEFTQRVIRDLYLRDAPITDLVTVDSVFRSALERGPVFRAREAALRQLRQMRTLSPVVLDYATDLALDRPDREKSAEKM